MKERINPGLRRALEHENIKMLTDEEYLLRVYARNDKKAVVLEDEPSDILERTRWRNRDEL